MNRPKHLFVIGAPRSGTTMLGRYLASSGRACVLGEFFGHYAAIYRLPRIYGSVTTPENLAFREAMIAHSFSQVESSRREADADYTVNDCPFNARCAAEIARHCDDAHFIITLREASEVVSSLGRAFDAGRAWAGADLQQRLELWSEFYAEVYKLDPGRCTLFDYTAFGREPDIELERFLIEFESATSIDPSTLDRAVFTRGWAVDDCEARPLAGAFRPDGSIMLQPFAKPLPPPQSEDFCWKLAEQLYADILMTFRPQASS